MEGLELIDSGASLKKLEVFYQLRAQLHKSEARD
jgi:hypothetical protein